MDSDRHPNRIALQRLWYYFLRAYVRIGLQFYFRKVIVEGTENINPGPVIFAANHQNAFMDALLIVCFNSRYTFSLTRADIFKKPVARWFLTTLNMIPIYRIRDGRQSLVENQTTFEACCRIFMKNEAVIIFPEGNHGGQRRLRSLSKGFARIAFESLRQQPELKISIVPVGLNYSRHPDFRSKVRVIFGKAFLANDYYDIHDTAGANRLRNDLAERLKSLITHVEDASRYDEIIRELENTKPDYLLPQDVNARIATIVQGVQPGVSPAVVNNKGGRSLLYYLHRILNFPPLFIWHYIKSSIKDPVFIASMKFGIGIFLFPAYYFLIAILLIIWAGAWVALGWLIICFLSNLMLRD